MLKKCFSVTLNVVQGLVLTDSIEFIVHECRGAPLRAPKWAATEGCPYDFSNFAGELG